MHSLLKDGSNVEQYFRFLIRKYLLLLRVIEQVDRFGDLEDIPLPDASNDIDFLRQNYDLLAVEIEYADQATEMVRLKVFVLLFFHVGVLFGEFALAIDLDDGGDATFVEIGNDDELLLADPDCYGLQIELFGEFVDLEQTGELLYE